MKLRREVIWTNACWASYCKRCPKVWRMGGGACTTQVPPPPVRWGGEEGEHSLPEQDSMLGPPPGTLGDTLGPPKGLPVYVLEDTRAPNPHTPVGKACLTCQICGCLHLSLEGANLDVVGIPPAETRMKARLCPARINTPPPSCPLPVYPPCFLPHCSLAASSGRADPGQEVSIPTHAQPPRGQNPGNPKKP